MKKHAFDGLSFIAGVFFTGIGLAFLLIPDLSELIGFFTDAGSWFWPLVLVAIGIAVITPALTRRNDEEPEKGGI